MKFKEISQDEYENTRIFNGYVKRMREQIKYLDKMINTYEKIVDKRGVNSSLAGDVMQASDELHLILKWFKPTL